MVMRVLQRVTMAAARKGVYWLDEEVEMMLEALVDMEAAVDYISGPGETAHVEEEGERAVEYISAPGETPHVNEEWERGRLEVASILAPKGQPTPVVISSAVESEEAEARPSTSQQAPKNDLPGVRHRVEALEKGLKSLKTTVDKVRFNVFFIKTGMKAINQTLTEMRLDLALERQQREDRGDETEEEDVEEQEQVEVDPEDDKEGNAEDGGSPMQ
ncbi:UNVERIFIED_CONTAM: hypothetical protein K2H54_026268 [Gekko kuhli]